MSEAPNYFKFHLGDYARDCEDLSMLQHGAYIGLMRWYYSTAKPLPNDLERINRRMFAHSTEERNAVMYVLENFFRLDGNVWRHKRIDIELSEWQSKSDIAQQSATRRWKNTNENNKGEYANAERTHSGRNANQNQNQNQNQKNNTPLPPKGGFSAFWAEWPSSQRKVAKAKCLETWTRYRLDPLSDAIVAHVRSMKTCRQWNDGYEPAPLTYLRQRRWEDPVPTDEQPTKQTWN